MLGYNCVLRVHYICFCVTTIPDKTDKTRMLLAAIWLRLACTRPRPVSGLKRSWLMQTSDVKGLFLAAACLGLVGRAHRGPTLKCTTRDPITTTTPPADFGHNASSAGFTCLNRPNELLVQRLQAIIDCYGCYCTWHNVCQFGKTLINWLLLSEAMLKVFTVWKKYLMTNDW